MRLDAQYSSLARQTETRLFGMWAFLATELLLFAGLFVLYAAYRAEYPADFAAAASRNSAALGTLNTAVLITSSFTVAYAIHAVRTDRPRLAQLLLLITLAFGLTFLGVKSVEYRGHFAEGIYPGRFYAFTALPAPGARMFFTLYYVATLLHAAHVVAGMSVLTVALIQTRRGRYTAAHYLGLELAGLYWHLVDIIWIFLWPILYLLSGAA